MDTVVKLEVTSAGKAVPGMDVKLEATADPSTGTDDGTEATAADSEGTATTVEVRIVAVDVAAARGEASDVRAMVVGCPPTTVVMVVTSFTSAPWKGAARAAMNEHINDNIRGRKEEHVQWLTRRAERTKLSMCIILI